MNPDQPAGAFLKPSRLDRDIQKFARRMDRAKQKAREEEADRKRWSALRTAAYVRDRGRCRAYGVPLKLSADNPLERAECHHLVYRSAGGTDTLDNLITLSPQAHRDEHEHRLIISGNPNGTLMFAKRDLETGRITEYWESAA